MNESAIVVEGLQFAYGRHQVLRGVDLQVPKGSIFGFLGCNGAGKTTTIKILLGLLRCKTGVCQVNGIDPQKDPLQVRQQVGYMAEEQRMFGWMQVGQIVQWVGSFYPTWDQGLVDRLVNLLELPRTAKVKTLSKGQTSRLAMVLALGHRPPIVILDDPTLGLDPIARKEFLRHIINLLQNEGVTVFFSSHLLYEIEPVADYVAILKDGVVEKVDATDALRRSTKRLVMRGSRNCDLTGFDGLLDVTKIGQNVAVTVAGYDEQKRADVERRYQCPVLQEVDLNLDEIFEAYVIGNRGRKVQV